MAVWIIEPRDPLIARDGRPFGPVPGARATSLDFPFPSTTTGGVRTLAGLDAGGRFRSAEVSKVKQISVRGPLLVELDGEGGEIGRWLAPAPADAVIFDIKTSPNVRVKSLLPLELPHGAYTDLPNGLVLVGLPRRDPSKPSARAPRFWYWDFFERWLREPRQHELPPSEIGIPGPVRESRMHVSIRPETKTADEERGALFQTQGLEFNYLAETRALSGARRLALAVATDAQGLKPGMGCLGGERRTVFWRPSGRELPRVPEGIKESVADSGCCRVLLLTPAYFREGWRPSWLLEERAGVKPALAAVALRRFQTVSGWDMERGEPKRSRRLVPSGTVYFLKLESRGGKATEWLDELWMRCVSDEEQDRRDGFGLAVVGTWNGVFHRMEV